MAKENEL